MDGLGISVNPVGGGIAWDWSSSSKWLGGVSTGQSESRDEAALAALTSLVDAGLDVSDLPHVPGWKDAEPKMANADDSPSFDM